MRWAHDHPEEYREIAALPLHQQNAALRDAIGYDPDRIRDEYEENLDGEQRAGAEVPAPRPGHVLGQRPACDVCGAPEGALHAHWCDLRGRA